MAKSKLGFIRPNKIMEKELKKFKRNKQILMEQGLIQAKIEEEIEFSKQVVREKLLRAHREDVCAWDCEGQGEIL